MIYSTRFSPTVNGYLHLGHLYMALINQAEARRSGGVFGMRFDDDQRYWRWIGGSLAVEYITQMVNDLRRFGVEPDYLHSDRGMEEQVCDLLTNVFIYSPSSQAFAPNRGAAEVAGLTPYPYVEEITAHKVVMDFIDGCNWLIRGIDLLSEDCLYRHFCEKFTLPIPRTTYLPRLIFAGDEVSKTRGNFKLKDYNDPAMVLDNLAVDCLIDPGAGWYVENVKQQPVLGGWAYGHN